MNWRHIWQGMGDVQLTLQEIEIELDNAGHRTQPAANQAFFGGTIHLVDLQLQPLRSCHTR